MKRQESRPPCTSGRRPRCIYMVTDRYLKMKHPILGLDRLPALWPSRSSPGVSRLYTGRQAKTLRFSGSSSSLVPRGTAGHGKNIHIFKLTSSNHVPTHQALRSCLMTGGLRERISGVQGILNANGFGGTRASCDRELILYCTYTK